MCIGGPLIVHAVAAATGRRLGLLTVLADVCALAGGFLLRAVFVFGSKASAQEPEAYFRLTEPQGDFRGGQKR